MKRLKAYMVSGALFVSIAGTLLHFAYEWSGNNALVGLFTPVNESTWEHSKLVFFPMLIFSLFCVVKLKEGYPCIGTALAFGIIIGTVLIIALFYIYSGILGYNIAVADISIFYISVISAFYISYKTATSCQIEKYKSLFYLLIVIIAILFIIFTELPPNIPLFISP